MTGIYIPKNIHLPSFTVVIDNYNLTIKDYNFTNYIILDYNKIVGHQLRMYYNDDCIKFNKNINIRASIIKKNNVYGDCAITCDTLNLDILSFNYIFNTIKTNKIKKNNIENSDNYLYLDLLYDESSC